MPEIKTKLVLEGEAQYSTAIKNATKAIKGLDAEQKLAQAQFNLTGDKEQYMADRAEILRKKIAEQEKAVKAAEEAVEKLRKMGVEPTNSKMQHWNEQLMKSKTELIKLQGSLANTEKGLTDSGTAFMSAAQKAEEYKDKTSEVATGINWQNTISSITGVTSVIETALGKVSSLVTSINSAMRSAADWADTVSAEAAKAELDPTTYQGWTYAAELIDTDVSTIVKAQDKLMGSMTSTSEDAQVTFNRLGVVTRETNGDLRDTNDVFWDTIEALGKSTDAHGDAITETERDNLAQQLFGKSYRELIPLLTAGRAQWEALTEEGKTYAAVSQENVDKLTALDDAQVKMDARLQKTKLTLAANLAPAFTEVADLIGGAAESFNEFLETPEGKQSLEGLGSAIKDLVAGLTNIDFEKAFDVATSVVRGLTDALNWITDNKDLVVTALEVMGGAFALLKISKPVLQFMQLIKSIQWLNVAKGASGIASAASGGASKAGLGLGSKLAGAASKLAPVATAAAPWLTLAAVTGATAVTLDKGAVNRDWGEFNALQAQMPELMAASADASIQRMQEIMDTFNSSMHDEFWGIDVGQIKQDFAQNANEILSALPNIGFWDRVKDMVDLSDGLDAAEIEKIVNSDSLLGQDWEFLGRDVVTGMANGITSGVAPESESGTALANAGKQIDTNIAAGIDAQAQTVVDAANRLASQVAGILGGIGAAGIDYGSIISSTIHAPAVSPMYGRTSGRGRGGASNGGTANVVLVMDRQTVARAVVPIVSDTFAADLQSRR